MLLLTTRVDLLPTHKVHNLSSASLLSMLDFIWCAEPGFTSFDVCCARVDSARELSSELSESFESTNTSVGSYSFAGPRSMPFTNLEALTTCALLIWANLRCQR